MHYVTEPTQYLQALKALEGSERLALDTETNVQKEWETKGGSALDPHTGEVSLLIVSKPKERPFIFDNHWLRHHGVDFSPLFNILTAAEYFIGANLKFDLKMMRSTFGVMPENVRDVILMAKMISNATGSKVGKQHGHSYADLCREYLDVHLSGKKDLRVSTWGIGLEGRTLESSWWREKLEYGARDVQYLFDLNDLMEKAICTPLPSSPLIQNDNFSTEWGLGMEKVMKIEHDFLPVVAQMEYRGMPVSETTMSLFQSAISEKLIQTAVLLSRELELDEPQKDWRGQEVPSAKALKTLRSSQGLLGVIQKALNFRRLDNVQAEVLKRMIEIMDKLAAVPTENLEDVTPDPIFIDEAEEDLYGELQELEASTLVEKSPLIKAILTFKQCTKQEGMDLRKFVNPKTGRLHYGLNQIGAATGRCIAAGMKVLTVGGLTLIEDMEVGDLVYCYDDLGKVRIRKVLNVWTKGEADLVRVNWQSTALKGNTGFVVCTPEHKFLTKDSGWVEAQSLKRYQKMYHLARRPHADGNGNSRPRLSGTNCCQEMEHSVTSVRPYGRGLVYDIEVEDFHNFICEELCVANSSSSGPNMQQISGRVTAIVEEDLKNLFVCSSRAV